jgi:hypothetical protein
MVCTRHRDASLLFASKSANKRVLQYLQPTIKGAHPSRFLVSAWLPANRARQVRRKAITGILFAGVAAMSGFAVIATMPGMARAADLQPSVASVRSNPSGSVIAREPSLFSSKPASDPEWGLMIFGGASAGRTRLIELMGIPWSGDYADNFFAGGALSRRLVQLDKNWKIEGEIGAGYRFKQVNSPETWMALFFRYDGFPWNRWVYTTVAVSTGLSYVGTVSEVEKDAGSDRGSPDGSKLLHYLAPEITFANPDRRDWEMLIRYHHRSGVFGTFNGVWGGSNVVTAGIRHRF